MRPLLLALDLDGTLIGPTESIAPRVVAAVRRAIGGGMAATIVTGRMYAGTQRYAEALGIVGPIVCYQGAAVVDTTDGVFLFERPLASRVALRIYKAAKADGYHVQLFAGDRYYCEAKNRFSALYQQLSGVEPIVVTSLAETFAATDSTKVNVIADPPDIARYYPRVADLCGQEAYVTRSNPEFIEAMDPTVNKGRALGAVAARLAIPMERVLAIGDSYNDIPMLRAAGFSVAMGSAPPAVKAAADAVVATVESDGVCEALERFAFAETLH